MAYIQPLKLAHVTFRIIFAMCFSLHSDTPPKHQTLQVVRHMGPRKPHVLSGMLETSKVLVLRNFVVVVRILNVSLDPAHCSRAPYFAWLRSYLSVRRWFCDLLTSSYNCSGMMLRLVLGMFFAGFFFLRVEIASIPGSASDQLLHFNTNL